MGSGCIVAVTVSACTVGSVAVGVVSVVAAAGATVALHVTLNAASAAVPSPCYWACCCRYLSVLLTPLLLMER